MSQINLKSISGITSITTPAGVDNQLTVHTNDTTQRVKVTQSGIDVTGVVTATSFVGDGSNLTGITQTTINTNADNRIITGSGTANTLNGEANLTFDGTELQIGGDSGFSGTWGLSVYNTSSNVGTGLFAGLQGAEVQIRDLGSSECLKLAANGQASLYSLKGGDPMVFYTTPSGGSSADRLRITSTGRFGFNRSSPVHAMHLSPEPGQSRIDLHMTNDTTGHNNTDGVQFGYQNSAGAYIWNFENTDIYFGTNNISRLIIETSASTTFNFRPNTNNVCSLGTNSHRWANIHTNDLNLSNEGSMNEVDGTWGQYTIQEGENDLFLINRRSGKRYKFLLQEV